MRGERVRTFTGSDQEGLKRVIAVREEIQNWVKDESSQRLYRTR
jgi:hypothetical protein